MAKTNHGVTSKKSLNQVSKIHIQPYYKLYRLQKKPLCFGIDRKKILCWNKTYDSKGWIKHDENVWFIEPMVYLCDYIERFSLSLADRETIFIVDDIIVNASLDEQRNSLLGYLR